MCSVRSNRQFFAFFFFVRSKASEEKPVQTIGILSQSFDETINRNEEERKKSNSIAWTVIDLNWLCRGMGRRWTDTNNQPLQDFWIGYQSRVLWTAAVFYGLFLLRSAIISLSNRLAAHLMCEPFELVWSFVGFVHFTSQWIGMEWKKREDVVEKKNAIDWPWLRVMFICSLDAFCFSPCTVFLHLTNETFYIDHGQCGEFISGVLIPCACTLWKESNMETSQWQSTNDWMRMNEAEGNRRRRRIGNWWVHCYMRRKITRFIIKTTARHGPRVLFAFLVLSLAHSWMSCFVNEIVRCTGLDCNHSSD